MLFLAYFYYSDLNRQWNLFFIEEAQIARSSEKNSELNVYMTLMDMLFSEEDGLFNKLSDEKSSKKRAFLKTNFRMELLKIFRMVGLTHGMPIEGRVFTNSFYSFLRLYRNVPWGPNKSNFFVEICLLNK